MVPLYKLASLPPGQRRRKLALSFATIERRLHTGSVDLAYLYGLVGLALEDTAVDPVHAEKLSSLLSIPDAEKDSKRICNYARHALLGAIGNFPAEWDLVMSDPDAPVFLKSDDSQASGVTRKFYSGISVFAEDIRSPFNLGSIFRTAEAFGAERIYMSELCVPSTHPRALRSAMGCIDFLPSEVCSYESLPSSVPVFALETGGTPISEFIFPEKGIVIIGSEELGVSPEGLERATYGRVSIPMTGIKASLNVGVAFGILMQNWTSYLACSASSPF